MDYRERWELKDYLFGRTLERRIRLFQLAFILLTLGFLLNFWYLQGVRGERYAALAENNRLRRIPTPPTRGVIFDRRQEVIASTRPSLNLVLSAERSPDVDEQLRRLVPILQVEYAELIQRVDTASKLPPHAPRILREDVSLEELARIEARRELFTSIEVQQTARRSYPHGARFGHVLGYVGQVSEDELIRGEGALLAGSIVGKSGIERSYDELLRGKRGWDLVAVNNLGRRIGKDWVGKKPEHGRNLELTLDMRLQQKLRQALGDEVGAGVFLDPWTGAVLAMVSSPSFDPNQFADGMTSEDWQQMTDDPRRMLHDRTIASNYAPGSTFKPLLAIAALESGTITPEEVIHCGGSTKIYQRRRLCWKRGGHGPVNLRRALKNSCNVYFYHLGNRLGVDSIHEYGDRFGLGKLTGIDLPGEVEGILPSREWKRETLNEIWYPGDTISVAIGQGYLAVTPVQMARMVSAVATNGGLPTLHLTQSRGDRLQPLNIDPQTLQIVRTALRAAVADGTGGQADLEKVAVAGKTGTAQVYRHSAGVDSDDLPKHERDHGWFVGYAPADHPRIAFAVVVEHGGHGGSSAAPVVRQVLESFFQETEVDAMTAEETVAREPSAG